MLFSECHCFLFLPPPLPVPPSIFFSLPPAPLPFFWFLCHSYRLTSLLSHICTSHLFALPCISTTAMLAATILTTLQSPTFASAPQLLCSHRSAINVFKNALRWQYPPLPTSQYYLHVKATDAHVLRRCAWHPTTYRFLEVRGAGIYKFKVMKAK